MKVLLATNELHPNAGGPSLLVNSLARYLDAAGVQAPMVSADFYRVGVAARDLLPRLRTANLVHTFGLWRPFLQGVGWFARRAGIPEVVAPIGMLEPWALEQSGIKKRLGWSLYQERVLERAAALHATSRSEALQMRRLGLDAPIAVIPHGVDIPSASTATPCDSGKRTALFLSRLHPKKGILVLIRAWARLRPADWQLLIVGPDEAGYRARVEQEIALHGLQKSIELRGPIWGEAKHALLASSQLFVLPTYSENFGFVVAEALAVGTPVLTTQGTPWAELVESRCGWWVEVGEEPLTEALREALAMSNTTLSEMGARGRAMVVERYSWSTVIDKHTQLYSWLLGLAPRPVFVETGRSSSSAGEA